jgi:hypothetical protein
LLMAAEMAVIGYEIEKYEIEEKEIDPKEND